MRPAFKSFASVPALQSVDQPTITAYYKLDEASGSASDESTAALTLGASATQPGSATGLFDALTDGSRTFDGSASYLHSTDSAFGTWGGLDNKSVSFLVKPDVVAGTQAIFHLGTSGSDHPLIELLSTGEIKVTHPNAGSVQEACGITAGGTYLVMVSFRLSATTHYRAEIFCVDLQDRDAQIFYKESSDLAISGKGSSSNQPVTVGARHVSASAVFDEYFDGTVDELCLWNVRLGMGAFRELALNYSSRYDEDDLYDNGNYAVHCKVEVENDVGVMQDLSSLEGQDYFQGFEYGKDLDTVASDATLTLSRQFYLKNLAPWVSGSPLYGSTGPAIDLARKVRFLVAVVPSDAIVTNRDFLEQWTGFIDGLAWGDDAIEVKCRGRYAALDDNFIEPDAEIAYGSAFGVDAEVVMQDIIDDNDPYVRSSTAYYLGKMVPQVYTPTTPNFGIRPFGQKMEPVGVALQTITDLIGYRLAYDFDPNTRQDRLTFQAPDRAASSPMYTFLGDGYLAVETIAVNIDMIRNVASVGVHNGTGNEPEDDPRNYYESSDAASIAKYGRRYARIGEGSSSMLNSQTEAENLADAVIADLSTPEAELQVAVDFFRRVEVNDFYRLGANGVHFDTALDLAVYGFTHSFDSDGNATTTLMLRGKPASKVRGWRDKVVQPGMQPNLPGLAGLPPSAAPALDNALPDWIRVAWDRPLGRRNRFQDVTEVHVSTSNGFTPSASTLRAVTRGDSASFKRRWLDYLGTQYVKIIHRDAFGNVSSPSSQGATTTNPSREAVGFTVVKGSDQTGITAKTWTDVTWTTTGGRDNAGQFASNVYTIPSGCDGDWNFDVQLEADWSGSPTNGAILVELYVDTGGGYARVAVAKMGTLGGDVTTYQSVTLNKTIELAAGDAVKVRCYFGNDGGTMTGCTLKGGSTLSNCKWTGTMIGSPKST